MGCRRCPEVETIVADFDSLVVGQRDCEGFDQPCLHEVRPKHLSEPVRNLLKAALALGELDDTPFYVRKEELFVAARAFAESISKD